MKALINQKEYFIRTATADDADQLALLRYQMLCEFQEPPADKEAFIQTCSATMRTFLNGDRWICWVSCINTIIIGTLWLEQVEKIPSFSEHFGRWGYITNMYVISAYRNHGIGTHLLKTAKQYANTNNYELLIVWPSQASVPFYVRQEFKNSPHIYELKFNRS